MGSSQNWTSLKGSFLCILGSFLKVNVQHGDIFLGLQRIQIFFGVLDFPDFPDFFFFFWGGGDGPSLHMKK